MHRTTSRLMLLAVAAFLSGCATRPGPEVLQTTRANAPGAEIVTVYAATTRERAAANANVFTAGRSSQPNYASFDISVPPDHQPGRIEWPLPQDDPQIDPHTTFATVGQTILNRQGLLDQVATAADGQQDVVIFVHGYNYNFPEALYRLTQMSVDSGLDDTPILFSWPSQGAIAGYVADKESVTYSRDALTDLLGGLARDRRIGTITVFAHSMGGWLTVEALRQLRLSGQDDVIDRLTVVLAAPDIDVDVFRAQMQVIGPMTPPLAVLVSPDDRALRVSSQISRTRARVGALDIADPRVQAAAREAGLAIIDISSVAPSDGLNHDRYVGLAALYSGQRAEGDNTPGLGIRQAGAFIFNTVGTTLASPFTIVGEALAGE
ncbi:alpha/beta hydrolase [Paracoccus nototheniae]|uniref:Alpha/beta hydrolase n=1 Tax=Paracoccus nototheniae TaxID=2489002 RepID=A0ABW4DYR4_9RHOB|nr:alpha/beta fold hydrolase [Paracoccus nototheniae]